MPMVPNNFSGLITFTRASGATFVGSNGLIQLAATNVPRFDYDPVTLAVKGLLIEEQRTNLLTYSEQFDNASWTKSGGGTASAPAVTQNAAIAPDGTLTADSVVFALNGGTTISDYSWLYQNINLTTGTTCSVSFYIKAASASDVGKIVRITSAGIIQTTSLPADWQRVSLTGTASTTTTYSIGIRLRGNEGTADAATALIWGAQLEAGAFPTSYIPTVASQVTRSADVASVNTLSPWYNAAEGTLYAEVSTVAASARAATFSAGTVTNQLWVQGGGTSEKALQVYTSDAFVAQIGVLPSTLTKKIAGAYQTNNFAVSIDGGAAATDTSGAIGFFDRMNIGSRFDGVASTNGHIRRITYYPRRLSNAELQALTV